MYNIKYTLKHWKTFKYTFFHKPYHLKTLLNTYMCQHTLSDIRNSAAFGTPQILLDYDGLFFFMEIKNTTF